MDSPGPSNNAETPTRPTGNQSLAKCTQSPLVAAAIRAAEAKLAEHNAAQNSASTQNTSENSQLVADALRIAEENVAKRFGAQNKDSGSTVVNNTDPQVAIGSQPNSTEPQFESSSDPSVSTEPVVENSAGTNTTETTPVETTTAESQVERTSVITATPSAPAQPSTIPSQTASTATTRIDLTENDTPPSSSPSEPITNTETSVNTESQPDNTITDTAKEPTPDPILSEPTDPSLTIAVEEGINAINALLDAAKGIPNVEPQPSEDSVSKDTNTSVSQPTQITETNPSVSSDIDTHTNPVTASVVQDNNQNNNQSTDPTPVPITNDQAIPNSVQSSTENMDSVSLSNSMDISRITPESSRSLNTPPVPGSITETPPSTTSSIVTTNSIVTTVLSTVSECTTVTTTSVASSTCGTNVTSVYRTTCTDSIITSSNHLNVQTKVSVPSNVSQSENGHVKDKTKTSPAQAARGTTQQKVWNPLDNPRAPMRPGIPVPDARYPHPRFTGYPPQQTMRHPYPTGYPMNYQPGHPMPYPGGPMMSSPHPGMSMEYPGVYPPGMMGPLPQMMGPGMMPIPPHMLPPGHPMAMQVGIEYRLNIAHIANRGGRFLSKLVLVFGSR